MGKNTNSGGKVDSKVRIHDNKIVKPTLYIASGSKKKMVGTIAGEIVCDNNGTPIPYKQIGYLVWPENIPKDL